MLLLAGNLYGLPNPFPIFSITSRTAFRGAIYGTEPTLQFGQQLMSAMVEHNTRSHRASSGTNFKTDDIVASLSGNCSDDIGENNREIRKIAKS